jgi:hypothetical protein
LLAMGVEQAIAAGENGGQTLTHHDLVPEHQLNANQGRFGTESRQAARRLMRLLRGVASLIRTGRFRLSVGIAKAR